LSASYFQGFGTAQHLIVYEASSDLGDVPFLNQAATLLSYGQMAKHRRIDKCQ